MKGLSQGQFSAGSACTVLALSGRIKPAKNPWKESPGEVTGCSDLVELCSSGFFFVARWARKSFGVKIPCATKSFGIKNPYAIKSCGIKILCGTKSFGNKIPCATKSFRIKSPCARKSCGIKIPCETKRFGIKTPCSTKSGWHKVGTTGLQNYRNVIPGVFRNLHGLCHVHAVCNDDGFFNSLESFVQLLSSLTV